MSYNPTNLIEKQWQGIKNIVEPQGRSRKTLAITHRQVETAVHGIQPEVVGIFFSCCQTYLLFPSFNLSFTNTGLLSSFKSGKGGFAPSSKNLKASTNI